jgi:hypothetical protein
MKMGNVRFFSSWTFQDTVKKESISYLYILSNEHHKFLWAEFRFIGPNLMKQQSDHRQPIPRQ